MVSAVLLPNAKACFITSAGAPAVGYKVYTYDAGTLVPRTTYLDAAGLANNTNPIILDARGEAVIYWDGSYKVILKDAADVTIWTADNVSQANSVSPKFGINMVPVNVLDITQTQDTQSRAQILNGSTGTAASAAVIAKNNLGSVAEIVQFGGSFTTAGILRADGGLFYSTGGGGLTLATSVAQPIYLGINNVEVARFTTNGCLNIGSTTLITAGVRLLVESSVPNVSTALITQTNVAPASATVLLTQFTNSAPNNANAVFVMGADNALTRFYFASNGGLYNFSANNVNLSDITVKTAFERHTDGDLAALETSFIAVDWGKFKYDDQTHDDWNYGYSAQGVADAFSITVPALTDVWNPTTTVEVIDADGEKTSSTIPTPLNKQLKGVFTEDLNNIAHALLARALKDITDLKARLTAAGIP